MGPSGQIRVVEDFEGPSSAIFRIKVSKQRGQCAGLQSMMKTLVIVSLLISPELVSLGQVARSVRSISLQSS